MLWEGAVSAPTSARYGTMMLAASSVAVGLLSLPPCNDSVTLLLFLVAAANRMVVRLCQTVGNGRTISVDVVELIVVAFGTLGLLDTCSADADANVVPMTIRSIC